MPSARADRFSPRWTRRWSARRSRRRTLPPARAGSSAASSTRTTSPPQAASAEALPPAPDWDEHTRLQNEKEVLGFFVSGHPLDKYREKLRNLKVVDTATACEMKPEPQVFRRGHERAAERDPDCRRHHRPEGRQVETLRRDVCAGRARRHGRQDRTDRLFARPTRSLPRS